MHLSPLYLHQHHDRILQELCHEVPVLFGNFCMNCATTAPSLTQWSAESVAVTQSGQPGLISPFSTPALHAPNQLPRSRLRTIDVCYNLVMAAQFEWDQKGKGKSKQS